MAIVTGSVIGNLSGRLGNLSARTVNGQTILAARPSSFNASQEPAVLEVRQKFAVTANFAKNVLSLSTLAEIWKQTKASGLSAFNGIFKGNFAYSAVDKPTGENIITPGGFSLPVQNTTVATDNLTVELLALTSMSTFTPEEVNLSVNALVCFHTPISQDKPPFQLIALNNEIANYAFNQTFEANLAYNQKQEQIANLYTGKILYVSVASKNAQGKVIQYSASYTPIS
ncbi:MAG: hypothetical protein M0Q21_12165 [Ignavibacteriaceae bacterium]|nr:hypothetical protein [Ignavibacteriaceae bacterium]